MVSFNIIRVLEVSYSPGKLQNTMECTGGEIKLLHSSPEEALGIRIGLTELFYFYRRHVVVAAYSGVIESLLLNLPGFVDPLSH